jgi:hypothetical protein
MGQLYDLRLKIEAAAKAKGLDPMMVKGKLGMKCGVLFGVVNPSTPDDAEKIAKVKKAAAEVLGISL